MVGKPPIRLRVLVQILLRRNIPARTGMSLTCDGTDFPLSAQLRRDVRSVDTLAGLTRWLSLCHKRCDRDTPGHQQFHSSHYISHAAAGDGIRQSVEVIYPRLRADQTRSFKSSLVVNAVSQVCIDNDGRPTLLNLHTN